MGFNGPRMNSFRSYLHGDSRIFISEIDDDMIHTIARHLELLDCAFLLLVDRWVAYGPGGGEKLL
jgi:hypothetical protein